MKQRTFSLKTLIVTAVLSAAIGLGIAVKLDWLKPTGAQTGWFDPSGVIPRGSPSSFVDLTKQVQNAVVNISTTKNLKVRRLYPYQSYNDVFERFFEGPPQNIRRQNSLGSGFIISNEGYILTNNHVVSGADEIQVKLSDGRILPAQIIGADPKIDVAVIKIASKEALPTVTMGDSDGLQIGEWVAAIGNPFGLTHTVTAGIVSAKGRVIGAGPYDNFIQTDASINPGNSGGPLFNLKGEVVGINTAIIASGQGIGFATPINMAKSVIPQLIKGGRVERGYLGIGLQEVSPEIATSLGLNKPQGALVGAVYDRSPAQEVGILPGDLILSFNGRLVENVHELPVWISQSPVGTEADLEILRGKDRRAMRVKLSSLDQASSQQMAMAESGMDAQRLGMRIRDVAPQESQQYGVPPGRGVTVTDILEGSPAASVGIRPGDLILEVNSHPVAGGQDFLKTTQGFRSGEMVRLFVKRGPMTSFFAFRI